MVGGLIAGYITYILLSRAAPGGPAWETSFSTIQEIFNESLNFFYVNIAAGAAGLPSLTVPAVSSCSIYSAGTPVTMSKSVIGAKDSCALHLTFFLRLK